MLRIMILMAVAALVLVGSAIAEPIQWTVDDGGNGHWYDLVQLESSNHWCDIQTYADEQVYLDLSGYLVTITSQEEQNWLYSQYGCDLSNWIAIGLYQWPGSTEPNWGWIWITGESFEYTNWDNNEPNDFGGGSGDPDAGEDFGMFSIYHCDGEWNDIHTHGIYGYVVEYGEYNPDLVECSEWAIGTEQSSWGEIKKAYR